jgi:hypothetical protein
MTAGQPWRWHAGAAVLYAIVAWVFLDHGEALSAGIAAPGSDPFIFIWFLKWWPWAAAHRLDLFHTDLVWQPAGLYTVCVTSVPLLAALALPITLTAGPVAAYNLLVISAPVLSAWCAYRLCLELCGDPLAALVGGVLFGFSAYALKLAYAVPNLGVSCWIPLLAWVAVLRFRAAITRGRYVLLVTLLLTAEFLTSLEVCASLAMFAALAWGLAFLERPDWRPDLRRLLADTLLAAPIVMLVLSPVLAVLLSHLRNIQVPWYWTYRFSEDAASLVSPAPFRAVLSGIDHLTGTRLAQPLHNQSPEISLPLLILVILFARDNRAGPGRLLVLLLACVLVASLGPRLWFDGMATPVFLPWWPIAQIPLLGAALPMRFALYAALLTAVMASLWLSAPCGGGQRAGRKVLALLACLAVLPGFRHWAPVPAAVFFAPGRLQAALGPRPRLLILPFAINGPSSFWQAANDFGFSQTGGYLGPPPAAMIDDPAVVQLFDNTPGPGLGNALRRWCQASRTQYVVAGPGTPAALFAVLGSLRWPERRVDDVTVFTVPADG